MSIHTLKDVYIDQLQDLYSACRQSKEATSKLLDAASEHALKDALRRGIGGIEDGISTLEVMISTHGADPEGGHCKGMEGLAAQAEAHGIDEDFGDVAVQDAMIITQYQRMAHYAIAGYGCCRAFALRLGLEGDAEKLYRCLDSCYGGDRAMTQLAEYQINQKAA